MLDRIKTEDNKIEICLAKSYSGNGLCLYLNNYRVAGGKPDQALANNVVAQWTTSKSEIDKALSMPDSSKED